ncbi:hypothetical protein SUGI_0734010 [Cryptomeria japonica]|nr:hypothetical protein SUGI_0734010 [Cryptomeria japonica]
MTLHIQRNVWLIHHCTKTQLTICFGLLIFQLTAFSPLAKLFGPIHVTRTSAIISIPLLTMYPFIALLRDQSLWIIINFASLLKNILSVMTITGTFLLLNNAAEQDQRAAANGLQMSGMSLFKAIGPASAGILFSWGQRSQNTDFLPDSSEHHVTG